MKKWCETMYNHYLKRFFDILFAVIGMPFLLLILIFVAIAIKLDDAGPVFYIAERIGKDARIFKMIKFRTMSVDAPDIRLSDGSTYSAADDTRVTRVGRFLRKTSLDETPQFINVLKGDMSLIGPRPDLPDSLKTYEESDKIFLTIRPGITGYNQVYYRNAVDSKHKVKNDAYYTKNYSFFMDVKIFLKTVSVIVLKQNVYRNTAGHDRSVNR